MNEIQDDNVTEIKTGSCMFCGSHMKLTKQNKRRNTYTCPECGTTYRYEWSLPIFKPGTDTLTENGIQQVRLFSTLSGATREKVYNDLLAARHLPDIS